MAISRALRTAFTLPLLMVAGCVNDPQPEDYSPGYRYVSTGAPGSGKGVAGSVLAPEACLGAPADSPPSLAATDLTVVPELGPHLPPGCANAYNLQRMVESQRDLVEGRRMGSAAAAPTARAARRYLYGEEAPVGGANPGPQVPELPPMEGN